MADFCGFQGHNPAKAGGKGNVTKSSYDIAGHHGRIVPLRRLGYGYLAHKDKTNETTRKWYVRCPTHSRTRHLTSKLFAGRDCRADLLGRDSGKPVRPPAKPVYTARRTPVGVDGTDTLRTEAATCLQHVRARLQETRSHFPSQPAVPNEDSLLSLCKTAAGKLGITVKDELLPALGTQLQEEYAQNKTTLPDLTPQLLQKITLRHGAIGPSLTREFPALITPKRHYIILFAVRNFARPADFCRDVQANVDQLKALNPPYHPDTIAKIAYENAVLGKNHPDRMQLPALTDKLAQVRPPRNIAAELAGAAPSQSWTQSCASPPETPAERQEPPAGAEALPPSSGIAFIRSVMMEEGFSRALRDRNATKGRIVTCSDEPGKRSR